MSQWSSQVGCSQQHTDTRHCHPDDQEILQGKENTIKQQQILLWRYLCIVCVYLIVHFTIIMVINAHICTVCTMYSLCRCVHVCLSLSLSHVVQEPLESIITPAGFAPATHPPSTHFPPSHPSQLSHPHSSRISHSEPLSQDSESSHQSRDRAGKIKSENKRASPSKPRVPSSNDDSAANVSPLEGVPLHPDLIDPGPSYTNTGQ